MEFDLDLEMKVLSIGLVLLYDNSINKQFSLFIKAM